MEGVCAGCADVSNDSSYPVCPTALEPIEVSSTEQDFREDEAFRQFRCSQCGSRWLFHSKRAAWRRVPSLASPTPPRKY